MMMEIFTFQYQKNNYFDKYLINFRDDGILAIDRNGKIIYEIYLSEIFEKNGLDHLIFGVGPLEFDPFHLNEIEVAKFSSNFWEKGDLMLSLRHRSMILIYRPSTQKLFGIRWDHGLTNMIQIFLMKT